MKRELRQAGGDDCYDDEDEDNEDFTFTSPVETVDIVQYFLDTLRTIESSDANMVIMLNDWGMNDFIS